MSQGNELKTIKKLYGEEFMKLCRTHFSTLLEQEGLVLKILEENFATNTRALGQDIKRRHKEADFKKFVYSKAADELSEKTPAESLEDKTPYELLDQAGYQLFECKSEKEIQSFKKYYAPGEELCTFNGGRLDDCVVFFAVRKDVKDIRREDFTQPAREDAYGTSVMGIQFNKEGICTVSIKNRYNHAVNNPDATHGNNLEKIAPGLTESFGRLLKERGLELNSNNIERFDIPNYVVASDGKYYKYNMEVGGKYYCPGNVIIDHGEVVHLGEPEKRVLIDSYVLDLENKRIYNYDQDIEDSFADGFQDLKRLEVVKDKETGTKKISIQATGQQEHITIELDGENNIVGYDNENITELGVNFMHANSKLKHLNIPNVKKIKSGCLTRNDSLTALSLPEVESLGDYCFTNAFVNDVVAPKLLRMGNVSLTNPVAEELKFPCLQKMGDRCLESACNLKQLEIPNVTVIGTDVLKYNEELKSLNAPNLQTVGDGFLDDNNNMEKLVVPKDVILAKKWKKIRETPSVELEIRDGFKEQVDGMARTRSARGIRKIADYINTRIRGVRNNESVER